MVVKIGNVFLLLAVSALGVDADRCSWIQKARAAPTKMVPLSLTLGYSNSTRLHEFARDVSDPSSPLYRHFKTAEELKEMISPRAPARDAVHLVLMDQFAVEGKAAHRWSEWGHTAQLTLTVAQVEKLLHTQCFHYDYTCPGRPLARPVTTIKTLHDEFSSSELSPHVAFMGGVAAFPVGLSNRRPASITAHAPLDDDDDDNDADDADGTPQLRALPLDGNLTIDPSPAFASFDPLEASPVVVQESDKQVTFQVTIVCPGNSYAAAVSQTTFKCRDGSVWKAIRFRYTKGGNPTKAIELSCPSCSRQCGQVKKLYGVAVTCIYGFPLEDNYVRYAFGIDLVFDGGGTFAYDLQHYVVGAINKDTINLKRHYQVPPSLQATSSKNYQAVAGIELPRKTDGGGTGFYSELDLRRFYRLNKLPSANSNKVDMKIAKNDPSKPDLETQLDIQWMSGMAIAAHSSVWHSDPAVVDISSISNIIETVQAACATPGQCPWVLSFSYGSPESVITEALLRHSEDGFASLAALGVTVLVASGDSGAYFEGVNTDVCESFEPMYPASSAWVTSVGGTQLVADYTAPTAKSPNGTCQVVEVVASFETGCSITSGGGFSKRIAQPAHQAPAVKRYVDSYGPPTSMYDSSYRGYPDVSLFGHSYTVINAGVPSIVDGTSASSPALGGMVTLINDVLLNAGQKPLGHLAPLLYDTKRASAFHDVLRGTNGCAKAECCPHGFEAAPGWDPSSGVGTLNFLAFANSIPGVSIPGSVSPSDYGPTDCTKPEIIKINDSSITWIIVGTAIGLVVLGVGGAYFWFQRSQRPRSGMLQQPLGEAPPQQGQGYNRM